MLDHIGFDVSDLDASKAFYEQALAPLGIGPLMEIGDSHVGFGHDRKPYFWIGTRGPAQTALHVAFVADTRELVDAFHAAALAAGGRDNGPPGPRPQYHPGYYGAFVLDPDGNNVEAVCHKPG
jgi:catechol 2,3-dioxygenase-like lactoylglutathione lyase family enzyme